MRRRKPTIPRKSKLARGQGTSFCLLPAPPQQWVKWLVEFRNRTGACRGCRSRLLKRVLLAPATVMVVVIQTSSEERQPGGEGQLGGGHVPKEEILDEEKPFDFLVAGSGCWCGTVSYVQESFGEDAEDSSHQPDNFKHSRIARTALGYRGDS